MTHLGQVGRGSLLTGGESSHQANRLGECMDLSLFFRLQRHSHVGISAGWNGAFWILFRGSAVTFPYVTYYDQPIVAVKMLLALRLLGGNMDLESCPVLCIACFPPQLLLPILSIRTTSPHWWEAENPMRLLFPHRGSRYLDKCVRSLETSLVLPVAPHLQKATAH